MTKVLVRYGELGLKSERVMRRFLKRLIDDMSDELTRAGIDHLIESERGRIFVDCNDPDAAIEVLRHVSGVFSMSKVDECPSEYEGLMACLRDYGSERIRPGMTYGLKVKRMGSQPYTSRDIAVNGGGAVISHLKEGEVRVDLDHPDILIEVEIRENKAYIFTQRIRGAGGMPSGTQGRVVLYLPRDPTPEIIKRAVLSFWMLSRRGCTVIPAIASGTEGEWAGALRAFRIDIGRISFDPDDPVASLERICSANHAAGIAYPFDAGSSPPDPSIHPRSEPIAEFYPTAGLNRSELEAMIERFS